MVCEMDSLKNASPATVSRNGILFINEADIGWRPLVDTWLCKQENKHVKNPYEWMHNFIYFPDKFFGTIKFL